MGTGRRLPLRPLLRLIACALLIPCVAGLTACVVPAPESSRLAAGPALAGRHGSQVVALEFVAAYENDASEPYYPLERLAGCEYAPDGTLIVCDDLRGKVHGQDPRTLRWFEFDTPYGGGFQPVDVRVDGFRVLVLDQGGGAIHHLDLSGAYRDELVDVRQLDPGAVVQPTSFDIDRDGRMVIADAGQQEVLLLDTFLSLHTRVGGPGPLDDQFQFPAGIVFRDDGSFVVADRGNSRLALYGRNGFFERSVGGSFDPVAMLSAPGGVDQDRHGNLFVADPGSSLIHIFDAALRPVFSAGREFTPEGTPLAPVDVAVGPDGQLAVTDRARSAILVYRIIYQ